jgi:hypothetical protein
MQEILNNAQNPAWWFTGVFFILVGLIISVLIKKWIPAFLGILSEKTTFVARGLFRRLRLNRLKKIKRIRFDDVLVTREIIKNYSYLILYIISILVVLTGLISTAIDFETSMESLTIEKRKEFFQLVAVIVIPIYFLEVMYMVQSNYLSTLLKRRVKIR